jgi:hypothetical protein
MIYLLIYVDDIVASSSTAATEALLKDLQADFASFITFWASKLRKYVMVYC